MMIDNSVVFMVAYVGHDGSDCSEDFGDLPTALVEARLYSDQGFHCIKVTDSDGKEYKWKSFSAANDSSIGVIFTVVVVYDGGEFSMNFKDEETALVEARTCSALEGCSITIAPEDNERELHV